MKQLKFICYLLPFFLISCNYLDEKSRFDITYVNRVTFDTSITKGTSGTLISDDLILEFEQDLNDHNSRKSKIEYVRMLEFSLEVDKLNSPGVDNMNFLKSLEFYQIADGSEDFLVAKVDSVPLKAGYFQMSVFFDIDENMEKFLLKDRSKFRVVFVTDEKIKAKAVLRIAAKYEVDTRMFGI